MPKILPHIALYLRAKFKCALILQLLWPLSNCFWKPPLIQKFIILIISIERHLLLRSCIFIIILLSTIFPVLVPKSRAPFSRVPQMNPSKQNFQAVDGCLQPLTDLRLEEFGKGSMEPGKKYRQFLAGVLGTGIDLQEGFGAFYCSTSILR